MVRSLPCGDADTTSCSDRSGAAIRDYCKGARLRRRQARFVLARSSSEDAGYGTISLRSGGPRGIYCNSQIVPAAPPYRPGVRSLSALALGLAVPLTLHVAA